MLKLTHLIGKGASRECYQHPEDKNKCVKIFINNKHYFKLTHELHVYKKIAPYLSNFICKYDQELSITDKGPALISELIKDDNKQTSLPLIDYCIKKKMNPELLEQLQQFSQILLQNNIFFYDFNLMNFVVQIKNDKQSLRYIDLKSFRFNRSWTFIRAEKIIKPLARHIMKRRLKKLYIQLGLSPRLL